MHVRQGGGDEDVAPGGGALVGQRGPGDHSRGAISIPGTHERGRAATRKGVCACRAVSEPEN